MKQLLFVIAVIYPLLIVQGQTDSSKYDFNLKLREGIYLSYTDFRKNAPITREEIQTDLNKDQQEIFTKIVSGQTIKYTRNGMSASSPSESAWGYFQNNTLNLNYKGQFYRVPVFGAISYLVATVEVTNSIYMNDGFGGTMGTPVRSTELRTFLMDFYSGKIESFTTERAEELLSRDSLLFTEYKSLRRRQQKEQIPRYIRKYNDAHPIYFLK